jgi:probable O-glycosylation ligase (exosortase A-associated)
MKQLLFMVALTAVGTLGPLVNGPFVGVAVYFLFAVLRPQFLWGWALQEWNAADVGWSFCVAAATLGSLGLYRLVLPPARGSGGGGGGPRLSAGHYAALAFGGWVCVTYFTARHPDVAYSYFVEYAKLFVMFAAAALAVRSVRQVGILYLLTVAALSYIAYEVNAIYFFQGGYLFLVRQGYCGLDNNGSGLMLAMGVPLCYFAWEGLRNRWGWVFLLSIPLLMHAVLMSFSRGAMVSLIVAFPLLILRSRRRIPLAGILAAAILLTPLMAGPEIRARFFSISDYERDASATARTTAWAIAWRLACENPVFGLGIRNSNLYTYEYGADMEGRAIHSQYLQTAADSGFVGLALYVLMLVVVWRQVRRVMRAVRGRDDPEARHAYAVAAGVEASLAVFCVGSAFLSMETFELPYLLLLMGAQLPGVCRLGRPPAGGGGGPHTDESCGPRAGRPRADLTRDGG